VGSAWFDVVRSVHTVFGSYSSRKKANRPARPQIWKSGIHECKTRNAKIETHQEEKRERGGERRRSQHRMEYAMKTVWGVRNQKDGSSNVKVT